MNPTNPDAPGEMTPDLRQYFAKLGRKGGQASAAKTTAEFKTKRGAKGGRAGKGKKRPRNKQLA